MYHHAPKTYSPTSKRYDQYLKPGTCNLSILETNEAPTPENLQGKDVVIAVSSAASPRPSKDLELYFASFAEFQKGGGKVYCVETHIDDSCRTSSGQHSTLAQRIGVELFPICALDTKQALDVWQILIESFFPTNGEVVHPSFMPISTPQISPARPTEEIPLRRGLRAYFWRSIRQCIGRWKSGVWYT